MEGREVIPDTPRPVLRSLFQNRVNRVNRVNMGSARAEKTISKHRPMIYFEPHYGKEGLERKQRLYDFFQSVDYEVKEYGYPCARADELPVELLLDQEMHSTEVTQEE